jgi:hypothetical protein
MSNTIPAYSVFDDPNYWLDVRSWMYQMAYRAPRTMDNKDGWLAWLFWNENQMSVEEYIRRQRLQ